VVVVTVGAGVANGLGAGSVPGLLLAVPLLPWAPGLER
jgi:hypothetical protein